MHCRHFGYVCSRHSRLEKGLSSWWWRRIPKWLSQKPLAQAHPLISQNRTPDKIHLYYCFRFLASKPREQSHPKGLGHFTHGTRVETLFRREDWPCPAFLRAIDLEMLEVTLHCMSVRSTRSRTSRLPYPRPNETSCTVNPPHPGYSALRLGINILGQFFQVLPWLCFSQCKPGNQILSDRPLWNT